MTWGMYTANTAPESTTTTPTPTARGTYLVWHADWRSSTGNAGEDCFWGEPADKFGPPRSESGPFWTTPRLSSGRDCDYTLIVAFSATSTRTYSGRETASLEEAEAWLKKRQEKSERAWRGFLHDDAHPFQ